MLRVANLISKAVGSNIARVRKVKDVTIAIIGYRSMRRPARKIGNEKHFIVRVRIVRRNINKRTTVDSERIVNRHWRMIVGEAGIDQYQKRKQQRRDQEAMKSAGCQREHGAFLSS